MPSYIKARIHKYAAGPIERTIKQTVHISVSLLHECHTYSFFPQTHETLFASVLPAGTVVKRGTVLLSSNERHWRLLRCHRYDVMYCNSLFTVVSPFPDLKILSPSLHKCIVSTGRGFQMHLCFHPRPSALHAPCCL